MMTHVLSNQAIDWSRLTLPDRPAAAKTGTSEEFRDGVVMGYTPDLAAGVWMGNADNTPMAPGTFSSAGTGPMWKRFMIEAHAYLQLPPRPFERPDDVATSSCGGPEEEVKGEQPATKPGASQSPARQQGGQTTPPPAPIEPALPPPGTQPYPPPIPPRRAQPP